jgi:hypothetical protein
MVHDEIKAATRRRMAQTGEPYCLARRKVIEEHKRSASRSVKAGKTVLPISAAFDARVRQISRMADEAAANLAKAALNPANMLAAQLAELNPIICLPS